MRGKEAGMEPLYMIGSGAAVLLLVTHVAQLVWRRRARDDGYRQLADAFDKQQRDVWSELQALRAEYSASLEEMHERLDFAERLLTQGSHPPNEREEHATPA
jgi:hypothetical protein